MLSEALQKNNSIYVQQKLKKSSKSGEQEKLRNLVNKKMHVLKTKEVRFLVCDSEIQINK